jgi:hypothetical protein
MFIPPPPIFRNEYTMFVSSSKSILVTQFLVNSLIKASMAALLFLPILPSAFAGYICLDNSPDFKIFISSSINSFLGIPSFSNYSAPKKAISPFNNIISSFLLSVILTHLYLFNQYKFLQVHLLKVVLQMI